MENPVISKHVIILMVCILSLFGSHARYVFDHGKLDLRPLLSEYVVGLFTGICVYLLLAETSTVGKEFKYFCIIMSGFCARDIISIISLSFTEKFKKIIDAPNSSSNVIQSSSEKKDEKEEQK